MGNEWGWPMPKTWVGRTTLNGEMMGMAYAKNLGWSDNAKRRIKRGWLQKQRKRIDVETLPAEATFSRYEMACEK